MCHIDRYVKVRYVYTYRFRLPVSIQYSSPALVALTTLRGVEVVNTAELPDVTAVDGVTGVEVVNTAVLTDVTAVDGVTSVEVVDTEVLTDVTAVDGVTGVEVVNTAVLTDVTAVDGVTGVEVVNTAVLTDVNAGDGVTDDIVDSSEANVVVFNADTELDKTVTFGVMDELYSSGIDVGTMLEEVVVLIATDNDVGSMDAELDNVFMLNFTVELLDCCGADTETVNSDI